MKRRQLRLRTAYWFLSAALLLVAPLWRLALSRPEFLSVPETPVAHVNFDFSEQWRFLWVARHAVMPGSSYTLRASNPDDEMSLFMMSLGLCSKRVALPSSYFGMPTPKDGNRARYVLAYREFTGGEKNLRFVVKLTNGTVYERVGVGP